MHVRACTCGGHSGLGGEGSCAELLIVEGLQARTASSAHCGQSRACVACPWAAVCGWLVLLVGRGTWKGTGGATGSALGVQCAMSCSQSPECAGLAAALSIVTQCTLVVVITRLRRFPQLECLRGPSRAVSLVPESGFVFITHFLCQGSLHVLQSCGIVEVGLVALTGGDVSQPGGGSPALLAWLRPAG